MREDLRDRTPLDARAQRAVAERDRVIEALHERFRELALAIVCAPDAQRVRRIALSIAEGGSKPESHEWAWCSRMLADHSCIGICKQCGSEVHKGHQGRPFDPPECPPIYRALCPAEFGAVMYSEVCAA